MADLGWRERLALKHCCLGFLERPESFPPGAGKKTFDALVEKGLVKRESKDGIAGYRITEAGKRAYFRDG